jgi:hypothetical protein
MQKSINISSIGCKGGLKMQDETLKEKMEAVRSNPDNPVLWRELADMFRTSGEENKALDCENQINRIIAKVKVGAPIKQSVVLEQPGEKLTNKADVIATRDAVPSTTIPNTTPKEKVNKQKTNERITKRISTGQVQTTKKTNSASNSRATPQTNYGVMLSVLALVTILIWGYVLFSRLDVTGANSVTASTSNQPGTTNTQRGVTEEKEIKPTSRPLSVEEVLAKLDNNKDIDSYRRVLGELAQKVPESRREIAEITIKGQEILWDDYGKRMSLIGILNAINDSIPNPPPAEIEFRTVLTLFISFYGNE